MRAVRSWMGSLAALLLCCGWAQGHSTIPRYYLPYDYSLLEFADCPSVQLDVPAEMPTLLPPLQEVVRMLVEEYKQASGEGKYSLVHSLVRDLLYLGPDTAPLAFSMLCDPDKRVRQTAVEAVCDGLCAPLFKTPRAAACVEAALPACLDALKNGPEVVRMTLGFALCMTDLPPERIRPALLEALNDPSRRVQVSVVAGLAWSIENADRPVAAPEDVTLPAEFLDYARSIAVLGETAEKALHKFAIVYLPIHGEQRRAHVSAMLASSVSWIQGYALDQVSAAGEDGLGLFPEATETLCRIAGTGPTPEDAQTRGPQEAYVLAIAELLESKDEYFSRSAARYLKEMGPRARPAAPHLLKALYSSDGQVCREAFEMLQGEVFEGLITLDVLRGLCQKDDSPLQISAIRQIGEMGDAAADAAPELLSVLKSGNYGIQCAAASALAKVLPRDDRAVLALLDSYLAREVTEISYSPFEETLTAQGKASASAAALIAERYRERLRTPEAAVSPLADRLSVVLAVIGGKWLRIAAEGLESDNPRVVRSAVEALGKGGGESKRFLDKIVALAESGAVGLRLKATTGIPAVASPEKWVRISAVEALPAISPADKRVRAAFLTVLADQDEFVARTAIAASRHVRFSKKELPAVGRLLVGQLRRGVTDFAPEPTSHGGAPPPPPSDFESALAKYGAYCPGELLDLVFSGDYGVAAQAKKAVLLGGISVKPVKDRLFDTLWQRDGATHLSFMLEADIPKEELLAYLLEALSSPERSKNAAYALQSFGKDAAQAIPVLTEMMQPDIPFDMGRRVNGFDPRFIALWSLTEIGYDDDQAVDAMVKFACNTSGPRHPVLMRLHFMLAYRLGMIEPPAVF